MSRQHQRRKKKKKRARDLLLPTPVVTTAHLDHLVHASPVDLAKARYRFQQLKAKASHG